MTALLVLQAFHVLFLALHDWVPLGRFSNVKAVREAEAWWFPYFFGWKPERAAGYQAMFGGTYSFLPERYGIVPNTLHVILHLSTVGLLAVLAVLTL
jgi:hypothetical protein